jgi:hypothetical protein
VMATLDESINGWVQLVPVYPAIHEHVYVLSEDVHVEPYWHGEL